MYNKVLIILLILFVSCNSTEYSEAEIQDKLIVEKISGDINDFVKQNNKAIKNRDLIFPKTINTQGEVIYVGKEDWTSGYYPGILWLMYEITGEKKWEREAIKYTENLKSEQYNVKAEELGVKMMCSFGNGYRSSRNPVYKEVLINSAKTIMSEFDENSGQIGTVDTLKDESIISLDINDVMSLDNLFFAYEQTGDPVFYNVAVKHAETEMKNSIGVNWADSLRSKDDLIVNEQASALYGFIKVYEETNNPVFLKHSEKLANHLLLSIDQGEGVNFNNSMLKKNSLRTFENIDAAMFASALYKLCSLVEYNNEIYKTEADRIMNSLITNCDFLEDKHNGSTELAFRTTELLDFTEVPLFYHKYYCLEALLEKKNLN